jgi:hypothetical protein
VADLRITGFDLAANTVSGTTDVASNVLVEAWKTDVRGFTQVTPSGGTWTVDLDDAEPPYDLRVGDNAEAQQFDADGDATNVSAVLAGPRFTFGLELQEVVGLDWPAGDDVTLTIDRSATAANPDYDQTTTVPSSSEPYSMWLVTGNGGTVYFDLAGGAFQAEPGDVMTMTNGTTTKVQVVPSLAVDLPGTNVQALSGTTSTPMPEGSFLVAAADGWWSGGAQVEAEVGTDGSWSVVFPDGTDVTADGAKPYAYQTDVDGDMTESHAPVPDVRVDPAADRIWASDFGTVTGHSLVTLTIERSGVTAYTGTVASTNVLTRGSWNIDMWAQPTGSLPRPTVALYDLAGVLDVQGGDVVTVTDGVSTRSFAVAFLTVDSISSVTDVVAGQAIEPVGLHLGDGEGGYWGYQVEPSAGHWSYWFEPGVFPNPPDGLEPGMSVQAMVGQGTVIRTVVPSTPTQPSELVAAVTALDLRASVEKSLVTILTKAQAAYDRDKDKVGNTLMTSFVKTVQGLTPKTIPADAAARLISDAQSVIAAHSG